MAKDKDVDLSYLDELQYLDERDKEILAAFAKNEDIPGDDTGEIGMYLAAMGVNPKDEETIEPVFKGQGAWEDTGADDPDDKEVEKGKRLLGDVEDIL